MDIKQTVAQNLKDLRVAKGIYQKELEEALGVKQATIARYETGVAVPSLEVLVKYADYFEVPMDVIFGRATPKKRRAPKKMVVETSDFNQLKETILEFMENQKKGGN